MKQVLLLASLAILAACASGAGRNTSQRFDWRCAGGHAFSVRFNAQNKAEVFAGGHLYDLPVATSGSGARYSNGRVEYWEHQGEAMLNGAFGGPYQHCHSH